MLSECVLRRSRSAATLRDGRVGLVHGAAADAAALDHQLVGAHVPREAAGAADVDGVGGAQDAVEGAVDDGAAGLDLALEIAALGDDDGARDDEFAAEPAVDLEIVAALDALRATGRQPSVNVNGMVVLRARSRGGLSLGEPTHGIYVRDMGAAGSPVLRILDRTTEVPQPNNAHYPPDNPLLTTFVETPSFPRIDMWSDTIATRGNHQPVWVYALPDGSETRVGTTGIYTNPFGPLITGAAKLGDSRW